jgi:hypothetical protein
LGRNELNEAADKKANKKGMWVSPGSVARVGDIHKRKGSLDPSECGAGGRR